MSSSKQNISEKSKNVYNRYAGRIYTVLIEG